MISMKCFSTACLLLLLGCGARPCLGLPTARQGDAAPRRADDDRGGGGAACGLLCLLAMAVAMATREEADDATDDARAAPDLVGMTISVPTRGVRAEAAPADAPAAARADDDAEWQRAARRLGREHEDACRALLRCADAALWDEGMDEALCDLLARVAEESADEEDSRDGPAGPAVAEEEAVAALVPAPAPELPVKSRDLMASRAPPGTDLPALRPVDSWSSSSTSVGEDSPRLRRRRPSTQPKNAEWAIAE